MGISHMPVRHLWAEMVFSRPFLPENRITTHPPPHSSIGSGMRLPTRLQSEVLTCRELRDLQDPQVIRHRPHHHSDLVSAVRRLHLANLLAGRASVQQPS